MNGYYAYIRVSTVKQGEKGSSLQEQKDAIRAYASARNLNISEWFEETETAAKQGRRLFTRMIVALEKKAAAGVILHKVDRGARNLWDWARLQGLLDRGIEVHLVHESLDLNSRGGRLSANLQAVIAADYIWNLRDEVRKGINGRLKQGLYPMRAPIGYADNGKAMAKTIDPANGPLVRQAFELYATGQYNFNSLRAKLYELGFRTAVGKPISRNGLTTLLTNPFYIGIIRIKSRGELFQGIHEPLISPTLFHRVQDILHGRHHTKVLKHDFIFRRLLSCALCGYALIGEVQKGHVYYRCHTPTCPTLGIREDQVEERLRVELSSFWLEAEELGALRSEIASFKAEWSTTREETIRSSRLHLSAIDDRLQRLTDAYLDKVIDRDDYSERRAKLLHDRATETEKIGQLMNGTRSPGDDSEKFLEQASSLWLSYKNGFPHEKRHLLKIATSNLLVSGKNIVVELQQPFQIVALYRKLPSGAPYRDGARTDMKRLAGELWGYFVEAKWPSPTLEPLRRSDAKSTKFEAAYDCKDTDQSNSGKLAA